MVRIFVSIFMRNIGLYICCFVFLVLSLFGFDIREILASWSKLESLLSSSIIWKRLCKISTNLSLKEAPLPFLTPPPSLHAALVFLGEGGEFQACGGKEASQTRLLSCQSCLPTLVSLGRKWGSQTQQRCRVPNPFPLLVVSDLPIWGCQKDSAATQERNEPT